MAMSSFLTNSSPAAYASADPKFPPSEEYSQGNYIPDYYGAPLGHTAPSVTGNSAHFGYHPHSQHSSLAYSSDHSIATNPYHPHHLHNHHHHHHALGPQTPQCYNPCSTTGVSMASMPNIGNQISSHHSIGSHNSSHNIPLPSPVSSSHHSLNSHPSRLSSPSPSGYTVQRSPSPKSQLIDTKSVIGEPPSPSDCTISSNGNNSGATGQHMIYPWMKKVQVNQGKLECFLWFVTLLFRIHFCFLPSSCDTL